MEPLESFTTWRFPIRLASLSSPTAATEEATHPSGPGAQPGAWCVARTGECSTGQQVLLESAGYSPLPGHIQMRLATCPSGILSDLLGPSKGQCCGYNLMVFVQESCSGPGTVMLGGPICWGCAEALARPCASVGHALSRHQDPAPPRSVPRRGSLCQGLSDNLSVFYRETGCDWRLQDGGMTCGATWHCPYCAPHSCLNVHSAQGSWHKEKDPV